MNPKQISNELKKCNKVAKLLIYGRILKYSFQENLTIKKRKVIQHLRESIIIGANNEVVILFHKKKDNNLLAEIDELKQEILDTDIDYKFIFIDSKEKTQAKEEFKKNNKKIVSEDCKIITKERKIVFNNFKNIMEEKENV